MISRIQAFKYRCFDQLDIKVGDYHVLAGANGTGKSTLLDIPLLLGEILSRGLIPAFLESPAIGGSPRAQSLQELVHYSKGDYFGFAIEANLPQEIISNLLQNGSTEIQQDSKLHPHSLRYEIRFQIFNKIELHVTDEFLYILPEQVSEPEQNSLIGEKYSSDWQKIIDRTNGTPVILKPEFRSTINKTRLNLEPQELALANVVRDLINFPATNWFVDLLKKGVMRYEPSWEMLRKACPPGQPKNLRADAANLPWLVMNLQQQEPNLFEAWVEHIKMALPNIVKIEAIQREEDYHAYLKLTYLGNHVVTSSGLSYGTLHILALTILPYLPRVADLIFLEEPENGIHPRAIEVVLQSLSSVYNSQVFVSTHSPVVLAHTALESIIVMQGSKENGAKAIQGKQHPRLQNWQGGIDLGSLFAAGVR
ncbi:putative ATPase [Rivularia sp. PCC 7116]|uniref:methylation-associated defense system AAA family ATPase MAD3 n=1 Tax=Rivularia sp. PCC 7116 TaxID=373994 RepID=UPI00029F1361|nr:ATP-binding protein [Rivularia sp. PCC 7116]AFY57398.1 putative ATPase [Rivularia sp. PCC 7116]